MGYYLARERGGIFGGIARFDEGVRSFFAAFRRVELIEARAQNARLPIFAAGGDLFLLDAILHLPDFGAVIWAEAKNDQFEKRFVGAEVELVMKLGDEGAKFFEESDADSFQIGSFLARILRIVLIVGLRDGLVVAVEADGSGCGRNLPLRGAEQDADMLRVELQEAGRNRILFDGLIDGGENDDVVFGDLSDDAATGEGSDDFIFALEILRGGVQG